jgi:hypothetical protein
MTSYAQSHAVGHHMHSHVQYDIICTVTCNMTHAVTCNITSYAQSHAIYHMQRYAIWHHMHSHMQYDIICTVTCSRTSYAQSHAISHHMHNHMQYDLICTVTCNISYAAICNMTSYAVTCNDIICTVTCNDITCTVTSLLHCWRNVATSYGWQSPVMFPLDMNVSLLSRQSALLSDRHRDFRSIKLNGLLHPVLRNTYSTNNAVLYVPDICDIYVPLGSCYRARRLKRLRIWTIGRRWPDPLSVTSTDSV